MTIAITNPQARRLVLHLQGLTHPPNQRQTIDELYQLIVQLGFVQVDSIRWVERAHHMILSSRNQHYRPQQLHQIIEQDRRLFENYTHDASVIPSQFFPFWKHKFERGREKLRQRLIDWQGSGFLKHCDALLELIKVDGPIRSRDLERPKRDKPREMWQWHDGKAALEFLWRTGELSISARDGFEKVYDLSSRVIPGRHFDETCSHASFVDWACRSAIERLGFGSPSDIARYWKLVTIGECREWIKRQTHRSLGSVIVQSADGSPPRSLLARADIREVIADMPKPPTRLRALSPFDPVIRDRHRMQWLFDFDYRIEIYVPQAKRKYGYYVFPLLDSDRLVGRIDMRAHRQEDQLQVNRIWTEDETPWSDSRRKRLDQELQRQAKLAGVAQVHYPISA